MSPAPMPTITALYAGCIGLLLLAFAARISYLRWTLRIGLGDGGNSTMQRAIRVHGNAVEWALPALLLLLVAELVRAPSLLLHVCGCAIVLGRLLHALGVYRTSGASLGRMSGTILTWGVVAVLAVWNVWAFVRLSSV